MAATPAARGRQRPLDGALLAVVGVLAALTTGARRVCAWGNANPIPLVTLLGLAFFALLRVSLSIFYATFGIQPEDVGFGYKETLSRGAIAALGVVLEALVLAAAFAAAIVLWYALVRAARAVRLAGDAVPTRVGMAPFAAFAVVYALMGAFAYSAYVAAVYVPRVAQHVKEGTSISRGGAFNGASAAQATVVWLDPRAAPSGIADDRLLYLGSSDGVAVLFDVSTDETIAIPSAAIVLRLAS